MKHKHFLIIALFVFFSCTLAAAQTRRIEAKKKPQESSGFAMSNPELVFNVGHSLDIDSVCCSPDGRYIASGSADCTIKIWEVETGRIVRVLVEHTMSVNSICYSPDGKYLASVSWDGSKLWEIESGECIKTFPYGDYSICYSPDGKYIANTHLDDIVIWDVNEVEKGKFTKKWKGHTDSIKSLVYSPDGKYIASGSQDKTVKLWEVATGECVKIFTGHTDEVTSITYSPDGKYVASASNDKTVKVWKIATGECVKTLIGHAGKVYSVSYSPDGKSLASGSFDDTIKLWKMEDGECIQTLKVGHLVTSIAYSPDGKSLAIGSWANDIKLWKIEEGDVIKTFGAHTSKVLSLVYSPNGEYLLTGANEDSKLWDMSTGACIKKFFGCHPVAYSPDEKYILTNNFWYKKIYLSEILTEDVIKTFVGHTDFIYAVAYSPDGKYLATGSDDKTIKLWNIENEECIKTLSEHTDHVQAVSFSPNGAYLASGSKDNTIKIWEVTTGNCIKTLTGHSSTVTSVTYSPDGRYLASGSLDDTIKIWEIATGSCIKTLTGHKKPIKPLCYSPDGKHLASGSWDRTIKIWDVETGDCVKTLSGHEDNVNSVAYSPDGKCIASCSGNTIKFWNASTGDLLATTFNLKNGEWLTYTPEGFFTGSEWATKNLVHIVDGMKTVGIDQMYDSLYRPDLVSAKLSGEDISPYAQKVNFASLMQTGSAPVVTFLSLEDEVKERDVTIEFAIQNTGGGIGEVNLLLNGKNIRLAENVASKSGETVHFSHTITLQNGKNTVELYAKNEAGKVESLHVSKTLNWHGNVKKPNLYIFTVAINKYRDRRLQLKYAVPDAEFILKGFSSQKKSLYQNIFTYNLFDDNVTKDGLQASFKKLGNEIQADDVFVFYIAGHGVTEDGDYYYLPSNFRFTSSEAIQEQGISKNDLTRYLSLIKAGKTLMLIDTCNAGSFLGNNTRGLSEPTAINRLTRSTGHATIVASSDDQVAMEGYKGHGIFTYIVVEGLSGKADTDGDGFITLQELSSYVEDEVPKRSREKWGYEQIPMRDLRKQDFPIYTSGNR